MNFACDRCGRRYSIADEKVQGRQFRVKCKACEHTIVVSAAGVAVAAASSGPVPPPVAATAPRPPSPARVPATTTAAAPAATEPSFGDLFGDETVPPAAAAFPAPARAPQAPPPLEPRAGMSDAELAWLSGVEAPPPVAVPGDAVDGGPGDAGQEPPPARPRRRVALLAAAVGIATAVAAVVALVHGRSPSAPPPLAPPPAIAQVPAQPPAPAAAPAEPTPAAAAAPVAEPVTPAPAESPAAVAPHAGGRVRGDSEPVDASGGDRDRRRDLRIAKSDRKLLDLLDRKQDAAPAAPIEKTTLDTASAALDRATVEQTMADNHGAFGACVTKALKLNPRLRLDERKATLLLTVQPTGVVSSSWIAEVDVERSPLGVCLKAASRRVVFPAFRGEAIDVSVPLALSAVR